MADAGASTEERLRGALDAIGEGFALLDADFVIVEVNRETLRLDGRRRDELVGRSHWAAFPGSEQSALGQLYRRVMHERVPGSLEHCYRWPDGRAMWIEARAYPTDGGGIVILWQDITGRRRIETALAASERRYRALFESMDEAYAVVEVLRADDGRWNDFRFVEVNRAFMLHTGMPDPVGRTATELLGQPNPRWAQLYGQVLDEQLPLRVEETEAQLGRVFDLNVFCLDPAARRVAVLFTDITDRKRTEAALRASEHRQRFLLALADALRPLQDPVQVKAQAMRRLGEYLGVLRAHYYEVDEAGERFDASGGYDRGGVPLPGRGRVHDLAPHVRMAFETGGSVAIADVAADPRLGAFARRACDARDVRALLVVPRARAGRTRIAIELHHSTPHAWTRDETALAEEVAERTWASVERAQVSAALRESEARLALAMKTLPVGVAILDTAGDTLMANDEMRRFMPGGPMPSHDRRRIRRWTGFHADGQRVAPCDFPGARALRGETVEPVEMLYERDDGGTLWTQVLAAPLIEDGVVTGAFVVIIDIDRIKQGEAALRESEERLRSAVEVGQLGLWDWNLETGAVHWSDQHYRLEGYEVGEVIPSYEAWRARVHPDDLEATEAALRDAMASGGDYQAEFRVLHGDGTSRWMAARGRFEHDADGHARRMVGAMQDVTERREWADRQAVLVKELQHRTRNLIGVVRAFMRQTAASSAGIDDFCARFSDRLDALARVQGLLSRLGEHDRVTFDELVRCEIDAMGGAHERIALSGPEGIRLRSSTVQTLAMALHELATNAVKYGALGQPGGRLDIRWRCDADDSGVPWVTLDWRESGVRIPETPVAAPGCGQGRELIERALPYQLKARVDYRLQPGGLACTIAFPASRTTA